MSTGKQTSTQKTEPWAPAEPYLKQGMGSAGNLFAQGGFEVAPYAWDRVAPQSDATRTAYDQIFNRATMPSAVLGGAENALTGAMDMNQQYRNFDTVRDNVLDRVMPRVNDQFAASGMGGSSLHAAAAGDAATRALADVEYGAYGDAQRRALSAAGMAPAINQAGYFGSGILGAAGAGQDAYNQQLINADMQYWNEAQRAPISAMQEYGGLIQGYGGMGGTSSGSSGYKPGFWDYASAGLQTLPFFFK